MASSSPGYKSIASEIIKRIHHGQYAPGTYLPSENQLARDYGVTRTTIRKALEILKNNGTIESFQGKGYRVNHFQWEQSILRFYSFDSDLADKIDNPEIKIIFCKKINGLKNVSEFSSREHWEIKRLRFLNKTPLILENSYIPVNLLPTIKRDLLKDSSLYSLMKGRGINIVKAKEYLEPVLPSKEDQRYLQIDNNTPLFKTTRYTYNVKKELVELRTSLIRGDDFRFSVELTL